MGKKWIFAMKRKGYFQQGYDSRVCSDHLRSEEFQTSIKVLKPDANTQGGSSLATLSTIENC